MGAFFRFNCFKGHKIRRPEPLEPVNSSGHPGETSRLDRPIPPTGRPASFSSSRTKPSSRGSSLQRTSTEATTPPHTLVDTGLKSVPIVTTLSPENEKIEPKTDDASPKAAGAEGEPTALAPPPHPQTTDAKALEASPSIPLPPPSAGSKPIIDLKSVPSISKTDILHHRPSYENDTPTTPQQHQYPPTSTTAVPAANRPPASRISTAPASVSFNRHNSESHFEKEKEKRKSRLSRFLSTKKRKNNQSKRNSGVNDGSIWKVKEIGLPEVAKKQKRRKEETAIDSWEKIEQQQQQQPTRLEGRKWREDGDNESLFCY